jgi:hypothetical protein
VVIQLEGVRVARGGGYRPATRAELYVQARQLGLPGCSRMRKHELARAVARARRRPAAIWTAARNCREQLSGAAVLASQRLAALPVLLRRLSAALGRLRWTERIALPVAAVALAAGVGASMPVLIAAGTPEGVAAQKAVTPVPASQASPDLGRPLESSQKPARPAGHGASPTGTRNAILVAAQEGGSSAVGQPAEAPAPSSEGGAPEPSGGSAPQAPAGAEQDAGEPTPEPTPEPTAEPAPEPSAPAPAPPVGGGTKEKKQPAEKVTLCHNAGSKKAKTVDVKADAVDEHLAHGDTLGACP